MTKEKERDYPSVSVKRCSCVHKFQDKRYGKNMRVHNKTEKAFRCTICMSELVK